MTDNFSLESGVMYANARIGTALRAVGDAVVRKAFRDGSRDAVRALLHRLAINALPIAPASASFTVDIIKGTTREAVPALRHVDMFAVRIPLGSAPGPYEAALSGDVPDLPLIGVVDGCLTAYSSNADYEETVAFLGEVKKFIDTLIETRQDELTDWLAVVIEDRLS